MKPFAVIALVCACLRVVARDPIASQAYEWRNVVIGGGGFVTGLAAHPGAKDLVYARTDVGGAYRWDENSRRWIPITDSFGGDFTGVESLALDPHDTNRVYLAAGTYEWRPSAIFRSDDRGRTWRRSDVPFRMGGNESGRFNGERLAVSPADGNVLFFGSRNDGLWKSIDAGATWNPVAGFPKVERRTSHRFGDEPAGIICVLFDNTRIYAAVSTTGTNLFYSDDAGDHWAAVPGQPLGLRPNHAILASDGVLYLSYGLEAGPNVMTDGAVWKFSPAAGTTGTWTDITPLRPPDEGQTFGYGCVAADPQHPHTLLASTFCRWMQHDEIFRSTNSGATWSPLFANATWDSSSSPYAGHMAPHWIGSIIISPFDSNVAWFTTGYGVWNCTNLTAADAGQPTRWSFADDGLEETVPLALASPAAGAHLVSGLGDIDGFVHYHLDASPEDGSFAGAHFNNTEDIAVAGGRPALMARVGIGKAPGHVAISTNGGLDWQLTDSEPPDVGRGSGVAVSFDGRTIVVTGRDDAPEFTADGGNTWRECAGLPAGARVAADGADPKRFYAFDAQSGMVYASTNGAANFVPTPFVFSVTARVAGGYSPGPILYATPGRTGDLWLSARNGLWHSTDAGKRFERTGDVEAASALGFGKPAPGKDYPALFINGEVGPDTGIFRSDDAGLGWVRINDAEHSFGWINKLTGDPRVFGRVYLATSGRGIIYGDISSGSGVEISKMNGP